MKKYRWLYLLFHIAVIFFLILGTAACAAEAGTRPRIWIDAPSDGASVPSGTIVTVISHAYAREGIGHVQLVVDPITEASVAALAPVLELLDRG